MTLMFMTQKTLTKKKKTNNSFNKVKRKPQNTEAFFLAYCIY